MEIQLTNSPTHQFTNSPIYQLLLVTPAMSPSSASLRKHRRHSANFRMYARGRPHRWQRLRSRTLNLGAFFSFAIFAVVAIFELPASSFQLPAWQLLGAGSWELEAI